MRTPMARMRDSFNTLKSVLPVGFNQYDLNQCDPRFTGHDRYEGGKTYTKGVKNEFIRVFKSSQSGMSFAFAFNDFKEDVERTKVTLSVKSAKGRIFLTKVMTFEDAKANLRELNKDLKKIKVNNEKNFFKCLSDVFELDEIVVPSATFSEELKKLSTILVEEEQEYQNLDAAYIESKNKLYEEKAKVDKLLSAYREELEKKYKIAQIWNEVAMAEQAKNKFENKVFKKVDAFFVKQNVGMTKSKWNSLSSKHRTYSPLLNAVLKKYS